MEVSSALELVKSGIGLTLVASTALIGVRHGSLELTPMLGPDARRKIGIYGLPKRRPRAITDAFIALLADEVKTLVD